MRVAVVGAGPAGCAAAIELRRQHADVVLIDDGVDGVGEQLPPAARPLLERLALLPLAEQLPCVGIRAAWQADELRDQDFLLHPFGHGWLLDRALFGTQLRQRAVAAGAQCRAPVRLLGLERQHRWRLHLSSGALPCDFVIDATGRRNAVARLLGVRRRRFDAQVAMIGWLQSERTDADATLTVETTDTGWWYTCRLPGNRRVAAWITGRRPDVTRWQETLRSTRHVSRRVDGYQLTRSIAVRPADSSILERAWGAGWVAIGDAAASYDPLASRGLVSALQSGIEAAALVDAPASRLASYQESLEQQFRQYIDDRRQYYSSPASGEATNHENTKPRNHESQSLFRDFVLA